MAQPSRFQLNPKWQGQDPVKVLQWAVPAVLILVFVYSSVFTIEPEEVGVVTRFGKYDRTVESGLNFKMPFGVESVWKVPVERQLKQEFGFRTAIPGERTEYSRGNFRDESLMLTGDLNAAEVEWSVQYRIQDPYKFLFKVRNSVQTFRDINEAVMRQVVGDRTVNEVLTVGRQEIAHEVAQRVQVLCDQYETGIKVEQVVLQDVNPPEAVKGAFNEVNEAQQEKEKLINQARSEYNKVIPRARGEAAKTVEEARGYAIERTNNAIGEAARFTDLFAEYRKAKDVTRQRLYLETMESVLQKVGRKVVTDNPGNALLPLLDLNKSAVQKKVSQ